MVTQKQVDTYLNKLSPSIREICVKLRDIIEKSNPNITQEMKWGSPAYMYKGIFCVVWGFQQHADLIFYKGALMKDQYKLFNSGKTNLKSRTIKFTDISQIDEQKITEYLQEAIEIQDSGKNVKIPVSKDKTVIIPPYIKKILEQENILEAYEAQIYTYRKGYVQWIEQAKQEQTKQKRIDQMIQEVREGEVYMGMKR